MNLASPARNLILMLLGSAAILTAATATAMGDNVPERRMDVLGWIEDVRLAPGDLRIRAKLDTGADNSSLNAPDPEEFRKGKKRWVRFTVENQDGSKQEFEKAVNRMVRIRSASGTNRRYVVNMNVCLGNLLREVEVNLADRTDLSYQMLIGRSYLKDHILVDSGRKDTTAPDCDMEGVSVPAGTDANGGSNGNGNDKDTEQEIEDDTPEEEQEEEA